MRKVTRTLIACAAAAISLSAAGIRAQSPAVFAAGLEDMPLHFIENQGQLNDVVGYYIQGRDKNIYFTPEGVTFALTDRGSLEPRDERAASSRRCVVKLDFVGANQGVEPKGEDRQATIISYFKGRPEQHRVGIPTYGRLVYEELWPGIDLVYRGTVSEMKYEFVVRPGADPDRIRLRYRGADRVALDATGQLVIDSPAGGFQDARPFAYQLVGERRQEVSMRYALDERGADGSVEYGFEIGAYDRSEPLILDPSLVMYCGYIGGTDDDDARGIAVDQDGYAYVVGVTGSDQTSFPVLVGPDLTINDTFYGDAFIAKIDRSSSKLVYCGYIGGDDLDLAQCVAVDDSGIASVGGFTESTNFPITGSGPGSTYGGGSADGFVTAVSPNGLFLTYSGYLGGDQGDWINGISVLSVVSGGGRAHVTGSTYSDEMTFPDRTGPDTTYNGNGDAFVARLETSGAILYCGYIGGGGLDSGMGVATDALGAAHVTGITQSDEGSFPVLVGPDLFHNGGDDAFVAKVHSMGTGLTTCGYIGGLGDDRGFAIAVDDESSPYCSFVTGSTSSDESSFPVVVGPDLTHNGGTSALADCFVARVDASHQGLTYCGYIGGAADDYGKGIAVDASGRAHVVGVTQSSESSFPVSSGPDLSHNGNSDGFIAKLEATGSGMHYCGYIGGVSIASCYAIALGDDGAAYVAGTTKSGAGSFPVTPNVFDGTYNTRWDGFAAKIIDPTLLWCDRYTIPATGGTVNFTLDAGIAKQNPQYILLGSVSGTEPGIPLPGGLETLPVNWDYFTDLILRLLNTGVFSNFLGTLDANGQATAQLNVGPVPPAYVGVPIWFAFTLGNPFDVVSSPTYIFVVE